MLNLYSLNWVNGGESKFEGWSPEVGAEKGGKTARYKIYPGWRNYSIYNCLLANQNNNYIYSVSVDFISSFIREKLVK